jgi:hypothetical protein
MVSSVGRIIRPTENKPITQRHCNHTTQNCHRATADTNGHVVVRRSNRYCLRYQEKTDYQCINLSDAGIMLGLLVDSEIDFSTRYGKARGFINKTLSTETAYQQDLINGDRL